MRRAVEEVGQTASLLFSPYIPPSAQLKKNSQSTNRTLEKDEHGED